MNKILEKIIIIIIFSLSASCAYEPIFSEKNYNFEIGELSLSGDKNINKIIKNKLIFIKKTNEKDKAKYDISIFTQTDKNIISKDSKGDPLKFEITVVTSYEVKRNKKLLLSRIIEKDNIYNNISDKFELEQTEKTIFENLSNIISEIIISSIINLDDN